MRSILTKILLITLITIPCLVTFQHLLIKGIVMSPDSYSYSKWADILISDHFNYLHFLLWEHFQVSLLFYITWISVVAVTKLISTTAWGNLIVVLNYCALLLTLFLTVKFCTRYFYHFWSLFFIAYLLIFSHDILMWVHFVLSDISFMTLVYIGFLASCVFLFSRKYRWLKIWGLFVFTLLLVSYRPAGIAFAVAIGFILPTYLILSCFASLSAKKRTMIIGLLVSIFLLFALAWFYSYAMTYPNNIPTIFVNLFNIDLFRHYYTQGITIMNRPNLYLPGSLTVQHSFYLIIVRFSYFFSPYISALRSGSKFHAILFYVPSYIAALYSGLYFLFGNPRTEKELQLQWFSFVAFVFLISWGLMTALNFIDYDWRYRLPCLPILISLAGIGCYQMIFHIKKLVSNFK